MSSSGLIAVELRMTYLAAQRVISARKSNTARFLINDYVITDNTVEAEQRKEIKKREKPGGTNFLS